MSIIYFSNSRYVAKITWLTVAIYVNMYKLNPVKEHFSKEKAADLR